MYTALNDEDNINKRKFGNRLVLSGRALIILGVWSTAKTAVMLYLSMPEMIELYFEEYRDMYETALEVGSLIIRYTIILIVIFLMFLFAGLSAMSEGKGKKKKFVYMVMAPLIILYTIVTIVVAFIPPVELLDMAGIVIDLTILFACCDVLVSGIKFKSINKRLKERE